MRRQNYFAGTWYPDKESDCRMAVEKHARDATPEQGPYQGLIAPHAGWFYSGRAAAQTYRWLAEFAEPPDLVVIFGSHRSPAGPHTLLRCEGWDTPLGPLEVAQDLLEDIGAERELLDEPLVPRHPDNGVELHMPFIKYFFPTSEVLVLGVGAGGAAIEIGTHVRRVADAHGRKTVFIGSTDLTHYGPNYRFDPHGPGHHAVQWVREHNDRGFIDAVLAKDAPGALSHAAQNQSACCSGAVAATLAAIGEEATPRLVTHYLSCDIQPAHNFVGYAGLVL